MGKYLEFRKLRKFGVIASKDGRPAMSVTGACGVKESKLLDAASMREMHIFVVGFKQVAQKEFVEIPPALVNKITSVSK